MNEYEKEMIRLCYELASVKSAYEESGQKRYADVVDDIVEEIIFVVDLDVRGVLS